MKAGMSTAQLTMMAIGSVVGGSFFLGSAVAVKAAGPAVIISYILGGALVYFILFALSEMTVADPATGSFRVYAEKAYGKGLGFVVGWVYWTGLVLGMSSEAIAASRFLEGWFPHISRSLVGSGIIIGVTLLNLLGAERLSKLESSLSAVKILAVVGFVILGILLIVGFMPGVPSVGTGILTAEPLLPGGIGGIAGSMLIVMNCYAGFEIIGLAASEAKEPEKTVPKAIKYTVISLIGLFLAEIIVLIFLTPTNILTDKVSPMVAALNRHGLGWAGTVMNIVLITAILSTMLASVFGLGRMIRSLADGGYAPKWLKGKGDIPSRGIIFSGVAMLLALGMGLLLPKQVYIFLISSGGFSLLFAYAVIIAAHFKFRKKNGCSKGKCQLPGYPFSSWIVLLSLITIIVSMPLVPGQGLGLAAGLSFLVLYSIIYRFVKVKISSTNQVVYDKEARTSYKLNKLYSNIGMEASEELNPRVYFSHLQEYSGKLTDNIIDEKNKINRREINMKKVSEVMTKDVKVCQPHDSLTNAAKMMRDINCGSIPVCEGKKVIGMITDRDIVINCVANGKDANSVHIHDCMTSDVITCSPNTDVHECARMMADHQIRRIPVVENGEMVGICAIGDLATVNIYVNEAGEALSQISETTH